MANLFSLKSPEEVRQEVTERLFKDSGNYETIGAGLAYGIGRLFGAEPTGVEKAQKIQQIQQEVFQEFGGQPTTDLSEIAKRGQALASRLMPFAPTEAMQVMKQIKDLSPDIQDTQKQTNVLRKSVSDVTKNVRAIEESTGKMKAAAKSKTVQGDQALIFTWMKTLDPTSTVREGEYATAKDSTLIPAWAMDLYNKSVDGTLLLDTERTKFLQAAEGQLGASRVAADNQIYNILQQADQDKVPREKVLGTERLKALEKRAYEARKAALGLWVHPEKS